jgi:hypothetical protein
MHSLGKRVSPVQLRVGAPVFGGRPVGPQSNQRSGRRHKPAGPRAALGTARHFHAGHDEDSASTQQPADFFCKEIPPGQHPPSLRSYGEASRLEDPLIFDFGFSIYEHASKSKLAAIQSQVAQIINRKS